MVTGEFILLMIKSTPALILMFFIWPMTLGAALGVKKNLDRYLIGLAAVQALFFLVYIPAILFSWTFRTLSYSAAVLITAAGITSTAIRYMKADSKSAFIAWHKPDFRCLKNPCFLIAVAVIYFLMARILIFAVGRLETLIDPRRRKRDDVLKGVNEHA